MDDWNKFSDNRDRFEEYRNSSQYDAGAEYVKNKKQPKYVTQKAFVITLIFAIILSAFAGAGGFYLCSNYFGGFSSNKTINGTNYSLTKATGSELSIQEIIAKNENSVVAITTESVSTDIWARQYVTSGAGSGVVYSEDGYILTNNHVIDGASTITVTMHDGKTYSASLVASDDTCDIAVIKIKASNLSPVTIAAEQSLSVGDLAVAIGNPLGTLAGTATEGIISALEREITIDGKTMNLMQISSSINPGNSGGGVFDQYGNLIGLVVAKSSGSDVEGLGFAIPVDTVKSVADSLIENGYVKGRPALGVTILDLTSAQDAMKYGVSVTGVYIKEVTSEGAKKAGLQAGDLIYMIDKETVTSSQMLISKVRSHEVGDKVTLTIVRNDKMKDISVTLGESN
ncbi:MAG: trypsin-like peptidase domain-containing protein [Firmicutes bacterium]|nr:trypsin-like peptidase domain-containing protein [Bacillota bacterium]